MTFKSRSTALHLFIHGTRSVISIREMTPKSWKLSASVVLAVRSSVCRRPSSDLTGSASVSEKQPADAFKVLSLRRGQRDKHLPGTHVFPGGNLDACDFNPLWFQLYKNSGFDESSFSSISNPVVGGVLSPLMEQADSLPGWMSLRLCAIRETFEESGVLLCRSSSKPHDDLPWTSFLSINDLQLWQRRVRDDPNQMISLCEIHSCVPDVWGLHLWSNWLTPVQQRVRHNAFFFLAVLPSIPQYSVDNLEMDELKWSTAVELIEGLQTGVNRLPNPQLYEVSRLFTFSDAVSLAVFAKKRASFGCNCVMPVQERAKDGLLFLLPGDAAYVKKIDYETARDMVPHNCTLAELRTSVLTSDGALHRIEVPSRSGHPKLFVHNYTASSHVTPIATDELLQRLPKHKL